MALDWLDLGLISLGTVVLTVLGVYLVQRWNSSTRRCPSCGASMAAGQERCNVCQAPFDPPAGRPQASAPVEDPPETRHVPEPTVDPEVGVLNPGVRPWMVKGAFAVMLFGLGTRLLGMLQPAGVSTGIPTAVTTLLTVIGGVGMFLGFVVLDVA